MATRVILGYALDALVFDPDARTLNLAQDYSVISHGLRFEITEDSPLESVSNDGHAWQVSPRTGTVSLSDDTVLASGSIEEKNFAVLTGPDCCDVKIRCFEVDGRSVGYVASAPLVSHVSYSYALCSNESMSSGEFAREQKRRTYAAYSAGSVPGFGPGTMIQTQEGEIPVEWLETSDRVLTRDHGYQPIVWIGRRRLSPGYFSRNPDNNPICFPAGTLGPGCPTHDLYVTGDHRVLLSSKRAAWAFFAQEVLVPAKTWLASGSAHRMTPQKNYTVTHIVCARHQVIVAQGAWVETTFPGDAALSDMPEKDLSQLKAAMGQDLFEQKAARACLMSEEARVFIPDVPSSVSTKAIETEVRRA